MINNILQFTNDQLGQYLKNRHGLDENVNVISNLTNADGSFPRIILNKVVITLININTSTITRQLPHPVDTLPLRPRGLYDLYILISANFEDYTESVKFLGSVVTFFEQTPVFSPQNSPGFPQNIDRLIFEPESLTYEQMQSLWAALGVSYRPCVVYKIRGVTLAGEI